MNNYWYKLNYGRFVCYTKTTITLRRKHVDCKSHELDNYLILNDNDRFLNILCDKIRKQHKIYIIPKA